MLVNKLLNEKELKKLIEKKGLKEDSADILEELKSLLDSSLSTIINNHKKAKRLKNIDDKKEHTKAKDVLNKEEIDDLPSWVKADIDNASLIGTSKRVIQVSSGKKYHLNNKLNSLPGAQWTFFLKSVINTRYPTTGKESYAHHIRKIHPSPKPPQLMQQIIEFFTKENEVVLDYFMGVGGSLLGASLCGRRAIGIDLSEKYIQTYKEANEYLDLKEQVTINGNSMELLASKSKIKEHLEEEKLSLVLIDPPYGDMLSKPKTGEAVKKGKDASATPFTDLDEDLGNIEWSLFRDIFTKSVVDVSTMLKVGGHVVIFIKDMQPKNKELNLLHADVIQDINKIPNINYIGTKIWADEGVNLYPYGYPYSFVSNQIHQYIMIFKKVEDVQ